MKSGLFFGCCLLLSQTLTAQVFPKLIPYRSENLWGYADISGKVVINPVYDEAGFFIKAKDDTLYNPAAQVKINGRPAVIDNMGKMIIPPGFKKCSDFIVKGNLFFLVTGQDGKMGVIKDGDTIIPVDYSDIHWNLSTKAENELVFSLKKDREPFSAGYSLFVPKIVPAVDSLVSKSIQDSVEKKPRYFVQGELPGLKKKFALDSIRFIENGLAYVEKDKRQGVLVFDKLYFFKKRYDIISFDLLSKFSEGCDNSKSKLLMVVQVKDRYLLVDEKEKLLFDGELTDTEANNEYIVTRQNTKIGFFNKNICFDAIPLRYDNFIEVFQLPVSKGRYFLVYKILLNGKEYYVGQNGVEYFTR